MTKKWLNNKGFAISGMLYPIFVLFLILLLGTLSNLATAKAVFDRNKKQVEQKLNGDSIDPYFVFDGHSIMIAKGYTYTLTSGVAAYSSDGKKLADEQIKYESNPTFSNNKAGVYDVTYTATDNSGRSVTETKKITVLSAPEVSNFSYTGNVQKYKAAYDGTYTIEAWGASGGGTSEATKGASLGGAGGYTKGTITLAKNQSLLVYVGQAGPNFTTSNIGTTSLYAATYNGGGAGVMDISEAADIGEHGFPGGGATDIRVSNGKYRYVRDYINGSSINASNYWVEIEAYAYVDGVLTNVALNKTVTGSATVVFPLSRITDGNTSTGTYAELISGLQYVEIDLGSEYEIEYVKVWHYYGDSRTYNATRTVLYNATRTESNEIFNSDWSGKYVETSAGKTSNIYDWNNFDSLKRRIMVAAGGGGGGWSGNGSADQYYAGGGGAGGGLTGLGPKDATSSTPGVQTSGFKFAIGGSNTGCTNNCTGAGGGGYYGAYQGLTFAKPNSSGAGGSSFISGHTGVNAIASTSTPTAITHTGTVNHYSGMMFANTQMISGDSSMTSPTGTTVTGNTGNGYARISPLYLVLEL